MATLIETGLVGGTLGAGRGQVVEHAVALLGPVAHGRGREHIRRLHAAAQLSGGKRAQAVFQKLHAGLRDAAFLDQPADIAKHRDRMVEYAGLGQRAAVVAAELKTQVDDIQRVGTQVFHDAAVLIYIGGIHHQ